MAYVLRAARFAHACAHPFAESLKPLSVMKGTSPPGAVLEIHGAL
jgi:hypothetical protein